MRELQDMKVTEPNQTVELVCEISKKGLKVEWYKGNKKIRRDDKYNYVVEDDTVHKLIISKASLEEAGEYKAVYENLETSASLSVAGLYHLVPSFMAFCSVLQINIKFFYPVPPSIGSHQYEDRLVLKAGSSAAIEIPFSGSPEPTCTWKYKNSKLPDARRFKVDTIKNMTSMTIAKTVRSDSGKYSLSLENEYGKASFSIELVVLGEYSFPGLNLDGIWVHRSIVSSC